MVDLLEQLFSVIWQEEIVPRQWRDPFPIYHYLITIHSSIPLPNNSHIIIIIMHYYISQAPFLENKNKIIIIINLIMICDNA